MPEYNLIKRYKERSTRKNAIYAFCFNCVGGTEEEMPDPGYQKAIGSCPSLSCPLYHFRPYKKQKE